MSPTAATTTPAAPATEGREHVARARSLIIDRALIYNSGNGSVQNQIEDIEKKKDDESVEECRKNLPSFHSSNDAD
jgi:hypothetical protein